MNIQIRYNTDREKIDMGLKPWRILIEGQEQLATEVFIEVPCWTSQDTLANGLVKWHISCRGKAIWNEQGGCKIVIE